MSDAGFFVYCSALSDDNLPYVVKQSLLDRAAADPAVSVVEFVTLCGVAFPRS